MFGLSILAFLTVFLLYPVAARTSVELPAFCDTVGEEAHPPASLAYNLLGVGTTTLITGDADKLVVADIDFSKPPFPSTVYLVRKNDNKVLWSRHFGNNIVSATISGKTLYFYNDKLGYWIDIDTGFPEKSFLTLDNFGGLSASDRPIAVTNVSTGRKYLETSAIISRIRADGLITLLLHVTFNSVALGCFIDGETKEISQL